MSTLHLLSDHLVTTATQSPPPRVLAGGVLDLITNKTDTLGTTIRTVTSVVAAPGFVLYHAIKSRGALARILIAIAVSALVVWGVYNVTENQQRVTQEVNNGAPGSPALQVPQHFLLTR